jgi:ABC-type lipopolysaccharide export system ATPase subunit
MTLFNKRNDVEYYELGVFDAEWNKVPFAVQDTIMQIKHLETKEIDIYIREKDKKEAVYICSKSKLVVNGSAKTSLSSRICSKIQ